MSTNEAIASATAQLPAPVVKKRRGNCSKTNKYIPLKQAPTCAVDEEYYFPLAKCVKKCGPGKMNYLHNDQLVCIRDPPCKIPKGFDGREIKRNQCSLRCEEEKPFPIRGNKPKKYIEEEAYKKRKEDLRAKCLLKNGYAFNKDATGNYRCVMTDERKNEIKKNKCVEKGNFFTLKNKCIKPCKKPGYTMRLDKKNNQRCMKTLKTAEEIAAEKRTKCDKKNEKTPGKFELDGYNNCVKKCPIGYNRKIIFNDITGKPTNKCKKIMGKEAEKDRYEDKEKRMCAKKNNNKTLEQQEYELLEKTGKCAKKCIPPKTRSGATQKCVLPKELRKKRQPKPNPAPAIQQPNMFEYTGNPSPALPEQNVNNIMMPEPVVVPVAKTPKPKSVQQFTKRKTRADTKKDITGIGRQFYNLR